MLNTSDRQILKKILVPLDGTGVSEAIVPFVGGMARHARASLVLLTCVGSGPKRSKAQAYLEGVAAPLRKQGLGVATVVEVGETAQCIVGASLQYDTGLVAISAHAQPGGRQDLIGEVVASVLRLRGEPVLILREEDGARAIPHWEPPQALIIGLDGSALATSALPVSELMANTFGSEIVLVRAVLPPDPLGGAAKYYGAVDDFAERYLAGMAERLRERGYKVATRTGHRSPENELLSAADAYSGSLIVLSTRGRTGKALVLGSVTEKVIRSQRHPVLAVPAVRE